MDLNLLLSTLHSTDIQIGEWVNVMGYVTEPRSKQDRTSEDKKNGVFVQAIVLWSAGSIKLDRYEKALANQLETV